ncbi:MAG: DUF378 domain-containing protein [Patescibacteria group bacterium]
MKLHTITFILLIIGGLNWLLEVMGWGIVNYLPSSVTTIVYVLVGLSALYEIATHKKNCKHCDKMSNTPSPTM